MSKYYGHIGYSQTLEDPEGSGIWRESIVERECYGDIYPIRRTLDDPSKINDNISISHQISILSDPLVIDNFMNIKYITYMGIKWKVSNVEVAYPRLNLTLGDKYNEE